MGKARFRDWFRLKAGRGSSNAAPTFFRASTAVACLALAIVLGGSVRSVYFVKQLYDGEVESIRNRLEIPAQSMAHVVTEVGDNADHALRDIQAAASGKPFAVVAPTLRPQLLERVRGKGTARKIEIYDRSGTAVVSTVADPPIAVSVANEDFFRFQMSAKADQVFVSALIADPLDGVPKIVESRPILAGDGSVEGVVAIYLDADTFQRLFDSIPMPQGGSIALFNENGRQLVRSPAVKLGDPMLAQDFSNRAIFSAFRNGDPDGSFGKFSTIINVERFIAGVGGRNAHFVVTAGWDAPAALARWNSEFRLIIGGSAAALLIVAALFAYLIRQMQRNEALLRGVSASEAKLRELLAVLPDAVVTIDSSLRILFANSAAERLYQYDSGEMNGMPLVRIMSDATRHLGERGARETLARGFTTFEKRGMERLARRKDGTEFPVEINGAPYDSPGGKLLVSVIRDVTRRRDADMELRRSRENLARAQRIAGIGNFDRDLITGKTEWSEEFLRIWGITDGPAQATAEHLIKLVHPEDRAKFMEGRDLALQGKPIPALDFRITRPDGEFRILHREYGVLFDENGNAARMFGTIQDVTERKKIELDLLRSRENLAHAQRIACIGSFERDLLTGRYELSDEMSRIHGISLENPEAQLGFLYGLVHPEDRERIAEYRRQVATGIVPPPIDYRVIRPDGVERTLHRTCDIEIDANGRPRHVFGTIQDITERKKIEIELQRSRENLSRAQRVAGVGSFERDLVAGTWLCSDELYRLHGLKPEDPRGTIDLLRSLVHPEDRVHFDEIKNTAVLGITPPPVDMRIVRVDGVERVLHRECEIVVDEHGLPIRLIATLQDVTERKEGESQLIRSRENMARAQRIAGMGSFERDLISEKTEWSDEMYHILGIDRGTMVPGYEQLVELVHPEDRERFWAARTGEISGLTAAAIEYRIIRPDGMTRTVRRESAVVFDEDKRPIRLYGTLQDVTERRLGERRERELERQLLHSQKLEALGTLAGGIAHDLNNTLVPIMALSKITARGFDPDTKIRGNLDTIYRASEHARDLVQRVLTFSRKDEPEKHENDLGSIVHESLELLRATVPSSIQFQLQVEPTQPIPVDAAQLRQVVTNLITNAAQAIGRDMGTITINLAPTIGANGAPEICLSIADTGAGMDEATLGRIFEPFFTTKAVGLGTGLGLSIVHGIVTNHGGRIEVSSAPGKGTRLDLYFAVPVSTAVTSSRPAA